MSAQIPSDMPEKLSRKRGCVYWLRLAAFTLFALVLSYNTIFPAWSAYHIERPARVSVIASGITPQDMGLEYEDITFLASDDVQLSGWFVYPTSEANGAAIIVSHMYGNNRTTMLPITFELAERGYAVLVYDHRAHGDSAGEITGGGGIESRDVLGAIVYLESRTDVDPDRIGALGISMGAVASIHAAAQSSAIKALVVEGAGPANIRDELPPCSTGDAINIPAYTSFYLAHYIFSGVGPPPTLEKSVAAIAPRPLLYMTGGNREFETCLGRRTMAAAGENAEYWEIPGAGHAGGYEAEPEVYASRMLATFDSVLLP